ncbi:hypothetical protein GQ44DRAFT_725311 [Phaeosphaeriaceae sp. PMI808]|nr:hypothetical protein GQ44DRAFT_725311 [Phaeosphaeriaceae sp. PMI808]
MRYGLRVAHTDHMLRPESEFGSFDDGGVPCRMFLHSANPDPDMRPSWWRMVIAQRLVYDREELVGHIVHCTPKNEPPRGLDTTLPAIGSLRFGLLVTGLGMEIAILLVVRLTAAAWTLSCARRRCRRGRQNSITREDLRNSATNSQRLKNGIQQQQQSLFLNPSQQQQAPMQPPPQQQQQAPMQPVDLLAQHPYCPAPPLSFHDSARPYANEYVHPSRQTALAHSAYGAPPFRQTRQLTPQESRIADDNARVRAMGGSLKFAPEQIGYFWPNMPTDKHPDDIADISGKTYFRSARDFTDAASLCLLSGTMPEHIIRANPQRKSHLTAGNGLDRWKEKLKHFCIPQPEAFAKLQKETFTPAHFVKGRNPAEWFLKVKRYCRDAGYEADDDNKYVQRAWNLLDTNIRVFMQIPSNTMTSDEFLLMLEERKHELTEVLKSDPGKYSSQPRRYEPTGQQQYYNGQRRNDSRQPRYQSGSNAYPNPTQSNASYPYPPQRNGFANQNRNNSAPSRNASASMNQNSRGTSSAPNGQQGNRQYTKPQGAYNTHHNEPVTLDPQVCATDFGQDFEQLAQAPLSSPYMSAGQSAEENYSNNDSGNFSPSQWATSQPAPADCSLPTGYEAYEDPDIEADDCYYANLVQRETHYPTYLQSRTCNKCGQSFPSGNKLHTHVNLIHAVSEPVHNVFTNAIASERELPIPRIIKSTALPRI